MKSIHILVKGIWVCAFIQYVSQEPLNRCLLAASRTFALVALMRKAKSYEFHAKN